ncbi:hypothetical protein [Mycolicibacterium septicum]|uniref:hypothetical protein n=1 Tax=Mycolicibacterium septicum TaxID=98668 RepID=UPI00235F9225|nr:hypothetical protein [Mycolicibacterium septicum]
MTTPQDSPEKVTEVDAEPLGADRETDGAEALDADPDDGDAHRFTAADYQSLADEIAADGDTEPQPSLLDGLDPKLANHIQKLRHENAEKRVAVAELNERLQAASSEVAALQDWRDASMRRDVERLALEHQMIAPAELWLVADLHEMLDGDNVDPHKVAEVIQSRVPEHWRVPVQYPIHNAGPRSGATGLAQISSTSWREVLSHSQE